MIESDSHLTDPKGVSVPSFPSASQAARVGRPSPIRSYMPIPTVRGWSWVPAISVLSSLGLLLIAVSYNGSRMEAIGIEGLFWVGMSLLIIPATIRLVSPHPSRQERLGILLILGLAVYLVKVFYSPLLFTFGDELQHWRTAQDILITNHLFTPNPILPVSPLFPGLEIATHALVSLAGLTIFQAGILVTAAARIILVLAIFLFFEYVGGSSRIAGIATLIYMSNPHFAFFDSQFGYETLALSFAAVTLCSAVSRRRVKDNRTLGLTLVALIALTATIITHHITSYMLAGFLTLAALISYLSPRWRQEHIDISGVAILAVVGTATWTAYVGNIVVNYLAPFFQVFREVLQLIGGETAARQLYGTGSGEPVPLWVKLPGYLSVVLVLLWLPVGLFEVLRKHRWNTLILTLAIVSLLYPTLQFLRLTPFFGLTVLYRSSPHIFIGIGFVLALGMVELFRYREKLWIQRAISILSASVIFIGTISASLFSWQLPGPLRLGSYSRAVGNQSIQAAKWALEELGPGNRVGADRTNLLLMGSYGGQRSVTDQADRVWLESVLLSSQLDEDQWGTLRLGDVQYLVVDFRYLDEEIDEGPGNATLAPAYRQTKFDAEKCISKVFDSGDIRIYDVEAYCNAR